AAWLRAACGRLCLSSGYRLWRRLSAAQSALRARLCREAPVPVSMAREPLAQLVQHLAVALGGDSGDTDLFAAYQSRLWHGLFVGRCALAARFSPVLGDDRARLAAPRRRRPGSGQPPRTASRVCPPTALQVGPGATGAQKRPR